MSDLVTYSDSYDEGSAYGLLLLDENYKDYAYGSGPWSPQTALLYAINMGLAAELIEGSVDIHVPQKQIVNYVSSGLVKRWRENDWKYMSGGRVEAPQQWQDLLAYVEKMDISWRAESDHPMMGWARRCALAGIAEVDIATLKTRDDIGDTITDKEASRFWMTANESGYTEREARQILTDFGVVSAKDLAPEEFDAAMEMAVSKAVREAKERDPLNQEQASASAPQTQP